MGYEALRQWWACGQLWPGAAGGGWEVTTQGSSEGEGGCPRKERQSRSKDLIEVGEGKRAREGPRRFVHHQEAT